MMRETETWLSDSRVVTIVWLTTEASGALKTQVGLLENACTENASKLFKILFKLLYFRFP